VIGGVNGAVFRRCPRDPGIIEIHFSEGVATGTAIRRVSHNNHAERPIGALIMHCPPDHTRNQLRSVQLSATQRSCICSVCVTLQSDLPTTDKGLP